MLLLSFLIVHTDTRTQSLDCFFDLGRETLTRSRSTVFSQVSSNTVTPQSGQSTYLLLRIKSLPLSLTYPPFGTNVLCSVSLLVKVYHANKYLSRQRFLILLRVSPMVFFGVVLSSRSQIGRSIYSVLHLVLHWETLTRMFGL